MLADEPAHQAALDELVDQHHEGAEGSFSDAARQIAAALPYKPVVPLVRNVDDAALVCGKESFELRAGASVDDQPRFHVALAQAGKVVQRQRSLASKAERSVLGDDADTQRVCVHGMGHRLAVSPFCQRTEAIAPIFSRVRRRFSSTNGSPN